MLSSPRRHLAAGAEFAELLNHPVEVVDSQLVDGDERAFAVGGREAARGDDPVDRADLRQRRVVVPLVVFGLAVADTGMVSR